MDNLRQIKGSEGDVIVDVVPILEETNKWLIEIPGWVMDRTWSEDT